MMKAIDIMTTEVATIKGSATVADGVFAMRDRGIRTLIVERRHDQDAYGIVTQTDIVQKVVAFGKDPKKVRIYEVMTKPCIAINPNLGVEYVARLMTNVGIHTAPVIQEKLLGLISFSDIIHKGDFLEKPKANLLQTEIQNAIANAHQIAKEKGDSSQEAAVAWDIVEELQAEAAHQTAKPLHKTAFEEYCEENPSALEARMYDS